MSTLGIPIQILDGVGSLPHNSELYGNLSNKVVFDLKNNSKFHKDILDLVLDNDIDSTIDGVENLGSTSEFDKKVYDYLVKTRNLIVANPDIVKEQQNPVQMIEMFDYAIKNWFTPNRDAALAKLADLESDLIDNGFIRVNPLNGLNGTNDDTEWYEDEEGEPELRGCNYSYSEVKGLNGETQLVKEYQFNGLAGFWSRLKKGVSKVTHKIKRGFQKAGKAVKKAAKKVWKAVKKYNPASVAVRNGFLLALKLNLFHMADKLAAGYLSEKVARQYGFNGDHHKAVKMLNKVIKLHTNILGGNKNSLKKAILSGKRKFLRSVALSGIDNSELGVAATAASTTAASGIIAKVVSWLKELKPWKWLKKDPRKKALQEKYGRKEGRKMFRAEKRAEKEAMAKRVNEFATSAYNQFNTAPAQSPFVNASYTPVSYQQSNNTVPATYNANTPAKPKMLSKAWFVKHKKPLIIGGVAFLLLGGFGLFEYQKHKKKRKKKTTTTTANTKQPLNGIKKVELE